MAGHNCRVFERYAIVNRNDMADAILKLEQSEKQIQDGHEMDTLAVPCLTLRLPKPMLTLS